MAIKGQPTEFYDKQRWILEIDGLEYAGFKTCSEIKRTYSVIKNREGGSKDEMKKTGNFTVPPITLTRALSTNTELYEWDKATKAGTAGKKQGRLIQQDEARNDRVQFTLINARLVDIAYGGWDVDSDDPNVEAIIIEVEDFEREEIS